MSGAGTRRSKGANGWLLSTPALALLVFAASGPLLIVLVYSVLEKGDYSGVRWILSGDGWFNVLFTRDIFDQTISLADANLSIF